MGGLASKQQLRMSYARWALVCVPLIALLGIFSGRSVPVGSDNPWYQALVKPAITPPDWALPILWAVLFITLGFALTLIVNARGARGRGVAVALFAAQLALILAATPLFFGAHRIDATVLLLVTALGLAIATTVAFGRIRTTAAWLMLPCLAFLGIATVLVWRVGQLNPDAQALVPGARTSQVIG